ncbi:MAG: hypothetical protein NC548_06470 [Lachnospiraceae bacterium]|nr:hypothetical protein [Lachnospiraceae bacterium]
MPELFKDCIGLNDRLIHDPNHQHKCTHGELFQKIDDGYGHTFLKPIASNTVVLGGAITVLEKLVAQQAGFKPTTLNDLLGIDVPGATPGAETLCLFGGGTGGAALDFGNVSEPSIKQNNVIDLIPIRYGPNIAGDDFDKYYMKKQNADLLTSSWFLKEFDGPPVIKSFWKNAIDTMQDGTEIVEDVANSPRTEGLEAFAQIEFSLNPNDFHEYYEATGNLQMARYNSFGFYTGEKIPGADEYANVRLYAVVNFNNRDVSLKSRASFIYRTYALM